MIPSVFCDGATLANMNMSPIFPWKQQCGDAYILTFRIYNFIKKADR